MSLRKLEFAWGKQYFEHLFFEFLRTRAMQSSVPVKLFETPGIYGLESYNVPLKRRRLWKSGAYEQREKLMKSSARRSFTLRKGYKECNALEQEDVEPVRNRATVPAVEVPRMLHPLAEYAAIAGALTEALHQIAGRQTVRFHQ